MKYISYYYHYAIYYIADMLCKTYLELFQQNAKMYHYPYPIDMAINFEYRMYVFWFKIMHTHRARVSP